LKNFTFGGTAFQETTRNKKPGQQKLREFTRKSTAIRAAIPQAPPSYRSLPWRELLSSLAPNNP
jgi:hypothetical protein